MKFLLTSLAVPSHLWTMVVPTARALSAAGHEVAVATAAALVDDDVRARAGVPMIPLERMLTPEQLTADRELSRQVGFAGNSTLADEPESSPGAMFARFIAGILAERAAENLLEVTGAWRPDLVIRESLEFGGLLLAEKLGVQVVTLDTAPLELLARGPDMLPWLNRSRTALGIPAGDMKVVTGSPWVSWMAPGWLPADQETADYRSYQPPPDAPEPLDPAVAAFTGGRPFVLAAFGSLLSKTVGVDGSPLARVVEALGELPGKAVVALGDDAEVARWTGPRPANVHLAGFVQQRLLLPFCDLFVTHAGFGSLRESLTAGVPMVSLPLHSEQPANARRLAWSSGSRSRWTRARPPLSRSPGPAAPCSASRATSRRRGNGGAGSSACLARTRWSVTSRHWVPRGKTGKRASTMPMCDIYLPEGRPLWRSPKVIRRPNERHRRAHSRRAPETIVHACTRNSTDRANNTFWSWSA
ncbi:MAG: glycosyltransferase [Trebonia sp.]